MKKFINFCKKPLLIAFASLFGAFLIMLIVVCCVPHGNSYKYHRDIMGKSLDFQFSFKNGKMVSDFGESELGGTPGTEGQDAKSMSTDYKIEKGILYEIVNGQQTKIGKINSFKLVINIEESFEQARQDFPAELPIGPNGETVTFDELVATFKEMLGSEMEFTCATTIALRTTSIVMISVFGALTAVCVVLLILDKKGIIKYKENSNEETVVEVETVSSTTDSSNVSSTSSDDNSSATPVE